MTIEEQWSDADGCANLRRLLGGKRPLYEHTLGLLSTPSAGPQPHDEILVELFNASLEVSFNLGFVNGFGGLADFSLFPSSDEDSEEQGAWRGSARFLRSLNDDAQHFVFTALLSYRFDQPTL
jgi:hypothetical protein